MQLFSLKKEAKQEEKQEVKQEENNTVKCPKCNKILDKERVVKRKYVCYECGGYFRVKVPNRIKMVADPHTFEPWFEHTQIQNPLSYEGYEEKIQEARAEQAQGIVGGLSGEAEVTSDIKTLAVTIGLTIEDDSSAEDILEEIAEELEAQIDEAEGNPQELSTLMGYFRQLSKLDAEYTVIQEGQAKLFNAMELVSRANKQNMGFVDGGKA